MAADPDFAFTAANTGELRAAVARIVNETSIVDMHTHLYAPAFRERLLFGIDELLTYHYLIAEVVRATRVDYDRFWAMSKVEQADFIWKELFIQRSPLSEACRGVLTTLHALGLDTAGRDLGEYRAYFRELEPDAYIDTVFRLAGVESVVMTNDPFDDVERAVWDSGYTGDPRFHAALRIDPLLNDWKNACPRLRAWGYKVSVDIDAQTLREVRRFLGDWLDRTDALYMAVSFPPNFAFPEESSRATLLSQCVLRESNERNVPFAMMVGVTRQVNPRLQLAGDGVGPASLQPLHRLCAQFPDNRFIATYLARENQHELCVAARKHSNLLVFGCWWFLNNPSLIVEMTRMRVEMLGLSVVPQHSDARVLDQLVYKWSHFRAILAGVLADKYADLAATGWTVTESDVRRDVSRLLRDNFLEFVGKP